MKEMNTTSMIILHKLFFMNGDQNAEVNLFYWCCKVIKGKEHFSTALKWLYAAYTNKYKYMHKEHLVLKLYT